MCQAQLDTHAAESVTDAYGRLRRTHAGILRILDAHPRPTQQDPALPAAG